MARQKREIYEIEKTEIIKNIGGIEGNETQYNFSTRLNEVLSDRKITQDQLCKDTNISSGSISSYRNGKSEPSISNLRILAEYIGVSADWLLGMNGAKSPDVTDKEINKKLGLKDGAIKTLQKISEESRGKDTKAKLQKELLNTINYLLKKNEETHLFELINSHFTHEYVNAHIHPSFVGSPEEYNKSVHLRDKNSGIRFEIPMETLSNSISLEIQKILAGLRDDYKREL